MEIDVVGDFCGANPKTDRITSSGSHEFILRPSSETAGESFRLETKIVNRRSEPAEVRLIIEWPVKQWIELKDYLYVMGEADKDWILVPASTEESRTLITITAAPGETYVCLHPKYSYDDCEKYIAGLNHPWIAKENLGLSGEGRNIRRIAVTDRRICDGKNILIVGRNHACETSANYCIEGMLTWLTSTDPIARYALKKFIFNFLPMTNPDGVANGLDRFTRQGGADLNRDDATNRLLYPGSMPDKSHEVYFRALDAIKPSVFACLHSYNFRHKDQIFGGTEEEIDKFITFMPDQIEAGKVWLKTVSDGKNKPEGYCRNKFGATSFLLEVPWFGRNGRTMRETGVKIIRALILMHSLQKDNFWGEF